MNRNTVLQIAGELIDGDRHDTYGSASEMHARIARLWQTYLSAVLPERGEAGLQAQDVAAMMVLMKVSRTTGGAAKPHPDNWIDICGYAALAAEMEGENG
tara:strand:- start:235 stop:534 length:300 start_codon:yes stop_codon:yes gene_type:complete